MKKCVVCGKEFKPYRNTNLYCSEECRKIGKYKYTKEYTEMLRKDFDRGEIIRNRAREYYRKKVGYKPPICKICGKVIEDSMPNQKYHIECVLYKISRTINTRECMKWKSILYSRGYSLNEIEKLLKEHNY